MNDKIFLNEKRVKYLMYKQQYKTNLKIKNKVLLGFADKAPRFIVIDKNNVTYGKPKRKDYESE